MLRPCPPCLPPPGAARSPFAWRPFARSRRSAILLPSPCSSICWAMPTRRSPQAAQESLAALPGQEVDAAIMTDAGRRRCRPPHHRDGPHRPAAHDLRHSRSVQRRRGSDPKLRTAAVKKLGELAGPAELPRLLDLLAKAKSPGGPGGHGAGPERGELEGGESRFLCQPSGSPPCPIPARAEVRLAARARRGRRSERAAGRARARSVTPTPKSTPRRFARWAAGALPTPRPTCWSWPRRRATPRTR